MKSRNKISVIYCIECLVNGKVYIGSTVDVNHRKTAHFLNLRKNKHPNKHLQSSYNINGPENFAFHIIELCPVKKLLKRELFWIDENRSYIRTNGFNMLRNPEDKHGKNAPRYGQKHKSTSIIKMKEVAIKRWKSSKERKRHSDILKEKFKDPKIRKDLSDRMKNNWKNNPQLRTSNSKRMRELNLKNWRNPEYRKKMSLMSKNKYK